MKATIGAAIATFVIAVGAPAVGGASVAGAAPACSATAGVTVIVDFTHFPGGRIERGCAPGHPADALTALHTAGFTTAGTAQYGDAFLCRIDGLPTPAQDACAVTPPATAYWAFWHARSSDAKWTYASVSVIDYRPAAGSIEAFAFGSHAQPGISPAAALPPPPPTTTRPTAPPTSPPTVAPTTVTPATAAPPVSTATLQPAPTSTTNAPVTLAPTTSTAPASTRRSNRTTLPATSTTLARVVERAASGPAPRASSGSPFAAILTIVVVGCLAIGAFVFTRARRHRPA
jgi:hypothetical protein